MEHIKTRLIEIYQLAMKGKELSIALDAVRQLIIVELEINRRDSTKAKEQ